MSDNDIQQLENEFPKLSGQAFAKARETVLASGQSVLQTEGNHLVEVFPDGQKKVLKAIDPPSFLPPGSTFTIR